MSIKVEYCDENRPMKSFTLSDGQFDYDLGVVRNITPAYNGRKKVYWIKVDQCHNTFWLNANNLDAFYEYSKRLLDQSE